METYLVNIRIKIESNRSDYRLVKVLVTSEDKPEVTVHRVKKGKLDLE